jgi:hypothetical protein
MTDLVYRLRKRAEIRRQIPNRKSVQEGQPDRIADLLEEAANALEKREWVGLTDEDKESILDWSKADNWTTEQIMNVVENRLKERNT